MLLDDQEINIVKYFNRLGNKKIDVFMRFLSSIRFLAAFWFFMVGAAVLRNPEIISQFITAVILVAALHFGVTEGIFKHLGKKIFGLRKRPYVTYPKEIKSIGRKFSDSSFPSSHMTTTVAMLFVIVTFYPSLFLLAASFVFIMAFARLHNGMHYPSDVFMGFILGLLYGWIAIYLIR